MKWFFFAANNNTTVYVAFAGAGAASVHASSVPIN